MISRKSHFLTGFHISQDWWWPEFLNPSTVSTCERRQPSQMVWHLCLLLSHNLCLRVGEGVQYTPLKINMEHNHGGLEDHVLFWMRICRFHVNLPRVYLLCVEYIYYIYYICLNHFSLLQLLLLLKSISLAIISIMFAYLYIWQKISISIIVASRWLNHRYLKWLKTPNYQQLFSKFQDLVGLVVVLSHLTNQKKDIHKFASIHRSFNESSQQKDTQELYTPEV